MRATNDQKYVARENPNAARAVDGIKEYGLQKLPRFREPSFEDQKPGSSILTGKRAQN